MSRMAGRGRRGFDIKRTGVRIVGAACLIAGGCVSAPGSDGPVAVHGRAAALTSSPIAASADTVLIGTAAGMNNNNGSVPTLITGTDASGGTRRVVWRFDVSSLPPATQATVDRVRVTARVTNVPPAAVAANVELHAITESWAEGTGNAHPNGVACATAGGATWLTRDCVTAWTTAGGSFASTASGATVLTGVATGTDVIWDSDVAGSEGLIADVDGWRGGTNEGWLLLNSAEGTPSSARGFASRETATAPSMVVDYTCLAGRSGTDCEDTDGCAATPCDDGGDANATCADVAAPLDGYTCTCGIGFSSDGTTCVVNAVEAGVDAGDAGDDAATDAGSDASIDAGDAATDDGSASDASTAGDGSTPPTAKSGGCSVAATTDVAAGSPLLLLAIASFARRLRRRVRG